MYRNIEKRKVEMTEEKKNEIEITDKDDLDVEVYSVMPLRNTVLFPQQVIPIY
ncbi:uncharacterized protein METZ01_LOCUS136175, partial [marine metagenome]